MKQPLYLAHHGIKGMKWGVHRTPEQLGHPAVSSALSTAMRIAADSYKPSGSSSPKTLDDAISAIAKLNYVDAYQPAKDVGAAFAKSVLSGDTPSSSSSTSRRSPQRSSATNYLNPYGISFKTEQEEKEAADVYDWMVRH